MVLSRGGEAPAGHSSDLIARSSPWPLEERICDKVTAQRGRERLGMLFTLSDPTDLFTPPLPTTFSWRNRLLVAWVGIRCAGLKTGGMAEG